MSLMYVISSSAGGPVNLPDNDFTSFVDSGLCYSGVRFGSDGNLYERHPTGGWSRYGSWLLTGSASTYYISRTIINGTLTTDAGAGPLQLNASRDYDIQTTGDTLVSIEFDIASDVSGSPIVATAIYIFSATSGTN